MKLFQESMLYGRMVVTKFNFIHEYKIGKAHLWPESAKVASFMGWEMFWMFFHCLAYMLCFLFCLAAGICKDCTGKIKNTITRKLKYINNQSIEQLNAFGFALQPLLPKNRIGEPFHQLDLLSPNRPPTYPPNRPGGKSGIFARYKYKRKPFHPYHTYLDK